MTSSKSTSRAIWDKRTKTFWVELTPDCCKEAFGPVFKSGFFLKFRSQNIDDFTVKQLKIGVRELISPLKHFFQLIYSNPKYESVIVFIMNAFLNGVYPPNRFLFHFENRRLTLNRFGLIAKNPGAFDAFLGHYNPKSFETKYSFNYEVLKNQNTPQRSHLGKQRSLQLAPNDIYALAQNQIRRSSLHPVGAKPPGAPGPVGLIGGNLGTPSGQRLRPVTSLESFNIHKPESTHRPISRKELLESIQKYVENPSVKSRQNIGTQIRTFLFDAQKNSDQDNKQLMEDLVKKYKSLKTKFDEFSTPIMLIHIYLIVKVFVSIYINIFHSQNNAVKAVGALLYHYTLQVFLRTMPVQGAGDRTVRFYANEVRPIEPATESNTPIWKGDREHDKHDYLDSSETVPIETIPLTEAMRKTFEMEVFCNQTMNIVGYFNRMILQVSLKFKNKLKRQMLYKKIDLLKRNRLKIGASDTDRYIRGIKKKLRYLKHF